MSETSYWKPSPKGYCTEMSLIDGGKAGRSLMVIRLPDGSQVRLSSFKVHRNQENEVTHWSLAHQGREFVIFND